MTQRVARSGHRRINGLTIGIDAGQKQLQVGPGPAAVHARRSREIPGFATPAQPGVQCVALVADGVDDDGETVNAAVPGPRNALRHPDFASVDLRLSRRFDVPRGSLLAFIEISNVLNRNNVCCIDWDIEEDSLGNDVLEYSPDYWMPLLPAVGILWEF